MSREAHVRFWESVEVRFLCATHHLAEIQYRFNHRFDLRAILARLLDALLAAPPCPEHRLRAAEVSG